MFHGWKELHPRDAYGCLGLRRTKNMSPYCSCGVVQDVAVQFDSKRPCKRHIFRQNPLCSLLFWECVHAQSVTQLPILTCSWELLCIGNLGGTESWLCEVTSNLNVNKKNKNVWGFQYGGGVLTVLCYWSLACRWMCLHPEGYSGNFG